MQWENGSEASVHLCSLCQTWWSLRTHTVSETENRTARPTTVSQTITVSTCQSDINNQCRVKTPSSTGSAVRKRGMGGGGGIWCADPGTPPSPISWFGILCAGSRAQNALPADGPRKIGGGVYKKGPLGGGAHSTNRAGLQHDISVLGLSVLGRIRVSAPQIMRSARYLHWVRTSTPD